VGLALFKTAHQIGNRRGLSSYTFMVDVGEVFEDCLVCWIRYGLSACAYLGYVWKSLAKNAQLSHSEMGFPTQRKQAGRDFSARELDRNRPTPYDASASSVVESLYQTVTWKPGVDDGSNQRSPLPDAPYCARITQ
jgi:hypothetical protein